MGYQDIQFPKGTKFLVTGGAGFIGSNLVEALLNKGCFVRVLDNFSIGKKENLEEFMNHENFELIEGDIRDLETCQKACKDITYVLNQAAWGSVPRSIEMPLLYEEINIKGTLNMMTAARDNGVKRFVYASSSSVYGDEPNLPKVEGREGNLLSPYAITKKVNELYAKNYFDLYGLETVGMRYFNVFGRKQDPHSYYSAVIPKFVSLLLNDEAPTINGDGEHSRDFTYIDNVIEANLRACLAPKEACGKAYNIAYGGRVSLNELYEVLRNLLNKDIKPIYGPNRKGDIKHSNADISSAKTLLNYNPSYSFEDGIKLTIEWYKDNL
ncbi:NAD-dependent epimerase/dehydratase family protein [[Clostridium] sordellii]|uniref:SDR family oxidoreductase n=1 Tax=Paraclostridium sordellii TaxID=1505 RepID=UPI0005428591|nr:SDR family oxidoreductase [Paeniclostridium sordellii]CEK32833.1 NAD-dependent epimerase/dehydratase family protein,dTDP-glucose 4,6-dehydratase,Vi polysaccharide biosynthesis protein TviC,NAD dependent epimerase/dehydratase, LLPSF_EDH_00030 family,NAD dependent epimerase/dehydratase family [[Clostridium] sordellii] [Paeniclostridium sordellii]CEP47831.1 NAD-dependent epimerase/dehydratase family protein [[Clostridium] sordellii] [Paeniclostridium sordellii]